MVHDNSIESNRSTKRFNRRLRILNVYNESSIALTDREVAKRLGFSELARVQPRVTEMIEEGILADIGHTKCTVTQKTVRMVTTKDRYTNFLEQKYKHDMYKEDMFK